MNPRRQQYDGNPFLPQPPEFQPNTAFQRPMQIGIPHVPFALSQFHAETTASNLLHPTGFIAFSPVYTGGGGMQLRPTGTIPQTTGCDGGFSPLVSQLSGVMDPCMRFMPQTFMLASPQTPLGTPGDAAPQLSRAPQQDQGMNLQQSAQQMNQSRGHPQPNISWALTRDERKSYDDIFRAWDPTGSGSITGRVALEIFGQSGLSRGDLARIWSLADGEGRGSLNLAEFHIAMSLIYRALNGVQIPDSLPLELLSPSERTSAQPFDFPGDVLSEGTRERTAHGAPPRPSYGEVRSPHSTVFGDRLRGSHKDGRAFVRNDINTKEYKSSAERTGRFPVDQGDECPSSDLRDTKRQVESAASGLDLQSAADNSKTREDEELEEELDDLKYRVKRVKENLETANSGPRNSAKEAERRRLERDLLELLHQRIPDVECRMQKREREKQDERSSWERGHDRSVRGDLYGLARGRDQDWYDDREWKELERMAEEANQQEDKYRARSVDLASLMVLALLVAALVSPPPAPHAPSAAPMTAPAPLPFPSDPPAPPTIFIAPPTPPAVPIDDRGGLLAAIQRGTSLRRAVTKDRSQAAVCGRVIGDTAPPQHVTSAATVASPVTTPNPPALQSDEEDGEKTTRNIQQLPLPGGNVATATYAFDAEADDELSTKEGERLAVIDKESSDEWWNCRNSGGQEGLVPASYLELEEAQGSELVETTVSEQEAEDGRLAKQHEDLTGLQKAIETEERRGVLWDSRSSGGHESKITLPLTQSRGPSGRPCQEKTEPTITRMWHDRSGQFKVDAQYLGLHHGKVRLRKSSGITIDVPEEKISPADMDYVRKVAVMKGPPPAGGLTRESTIGAGSTTSTVSTPGKSNVDWFEFFLSAGCDIEDCTCYALSFDRVKMAKPVLPHIKPETLRSFGLREGDIIRVIKKIEKRDWDVPGSRSTTPKEQEQTRKEPEIIRRLEEQGYGGRTMPQRSSTASLGIVAGPSGTLTNNTRR